MAETNDFDLFIGLILARLYESRPQRQDLEATDFIDVIEVGSEKSEKRISNWSSTMFWLMEEKYIRYHRVYSGEVSFCFGDTELTEKGFRALNSVPASLSPSEKNKSSGNRLVEMAKNAGWKASGKLAEKGAHEGAQAISDYVQGLFS